MYKKNAFILTAIAIIGIGLNPSVSKATPVLLSDVPAYDWYHGCGPTAAGSVIGYWDLKGYSNLFSASGWDQVKLTDNVKDQISSPEHNARYDPKPDDLTKPQSWNCIADWFETSMDPFDYGWSPQRRADDAFEEYANYRGYEFDSWYISYVGFSWGEFVGEIDAGRPMMFTVDTDGIGGIDHFVPVFGYDDRGNDGLWYGLYTTWSESESVVWERFQGMGNLWGIGYATYILPISVPEPATMILLGLGAMLLRRNRR